MSSGVIQGWLEDGERLSGELWFDATRRLREGFDENVFDAIQSSGNEKYVELAHSIHSHPFWSFVPRSNDTASGDEQEGYVRSDSFIACALGGNGSGKTYVSAIKLARFLSETPAPVPDTPFWCIAESYEQVMSTVWHQKLKEILPSEWIDWGRITWYNEKRGWPAAVPLMPISGEKNGNWIIEFKSYEQGRHMMSAAAIGGAWFTEQFPWELFVEVLRGCREYSFPGSIFLEQTPVDPEKSIDLENAYEDWLAGSEQFSSWQFFRLNTESALRDGHVTKEWYDTFFGSISEEMQETRKHGLFSSYEGAIYQSYQPSLHVVPDDHPRDGEGYITLPPNSWHRRAIDWGASEEHPLCVLWGARDGFGCWWIYDEYWSVLQTEPWSFHINVIKGRHHWESVFHGNTYGDPSRPDLIREFGFGGVDVVAARNDVYPGIETVRKLLGVNSVTQAPMLVIDRVNCPFLARQMVTYRWLKSSGRGVNPQVAQPKPLKKDDDAVDALRYLVHSERVLGVSPNIGALSGKRKPIKRDQFVLSKRGVRLDKSGNSTYGM